MHDEVMLHCITMQYLQYLLYFDLQIFIQGRVMLKKITAYFLAICANFLWKIEKFNLEGVGVGILGTGFCSRQPLAYLIGKLQRKE